MSLLSLALGFILPSPIQAIRTPVKPSRFARSMPAQGAIAAGQANALRAGLSGKSGSEADFADEQSGGSSALGAPLEQWLAGAGRPWSATHANIHEDEPVGAGTGPLAGSAFKGWVLHRLGPGGQVVNVPHVIPTTLLDPLERTPTAADMVAAHDGARPQRGRLVDYFGD